MLRSQNDRSTGEMRAKYQMIDLTRMLHQGCTMDNQIPKSLLPASLFLIAILLGSCSFHSCSGKSSSPGQTDIPDISLQLTASGFSHPLGITHAGDGSGRMFIVEQGGLVKVIKSGATLTTPFLDVAGLLKSDSGEQGLLGIAFPPGSGAAKSVCLCQLHGDPGSGRHGHFPIYGRGEPRCR